MSRRGPVDGRTVRDWITFAVGTLGVIYETVIVKVDRPALLALFAAMLGLPLFLRRDEGQAGKKEPPKSGEDESG
jgi:hypothetical protein